MSNCVNIRLKTQGSQCWRMLVRYNKTRGPWTATPAQIRVKETKHINKHCTYKKYSKLVQLYWNTHSVYGHIFNTKGSFSSSSLNPYNNTN